MKAFLPIDDGEILDGNEDEERNLKVLFACQAHSISSNVKPVWHYKIIFKKMYMYIYMYLFIVIKIK